MSFLIKSGSSYKSGLSFKEFTISSVPNLEGWWDANYNVFEAAGDPAETGDKVTIWIDKTSNAREFTQSNPGNKPSFTSNYINGQAVITSNAALGVNNEFLENTTLPNSDGTNGATIIAAIAYTGVFPPSNNFESGIWRFGANQGRYPNFSSDIEEGFGTDTKRTFTPTMAINQFRIYTVLSKTDDFKVYLNGSLQFEDASNTYFMNSTKYIGFSNSDAWDGVFGDILYFSRYLSTLEREGCVSILMSKYGLT